MHSCQQASYKYCNRFIEQMLSPPTMPKFLFMAKFVIFLSAPLNMVGEMVQNSQSLYSFTFKAIFSIHEYIYSHSTTKFLFKKYIYLHLTTYFLFTKIFTHIYGMYSFTFNSLYSFTFNSLYSFTFTIEILVQRGAIFIQHFLRTLFAHH